MRIPRFTATAVATATATSLIVAAPQAQAYETTYDADTKQCTITFTDTDKERVNNAYSTLFARLGEQVRDSFEGEKAKEQAQIVWEYGQRKDVKKASDLPIPPDLKISNAQTALALGNQKDKYWRMIGFINASKKEVIAEQTITVSQKEAYDQGPLYGVDLESAAGGTIGGILFGGSVGDVREQIVNLAKEYAPEFAGPILSYGKALSTCADGKSGSGTVMAGSSMTTGQVMGLGIAGAVLGLLALFGLGVAARPLIDDALAGWQR